MTASPDVDSSGSCLCGAVRFTARGRPVRMARCYCRDCQRVSGSGYMANAIFRSDDVTVTGDTAKHASTSDSGNVITRHFCPTCGGRLFLVTSARPGLIVMAAGAFDDSSWFETQVVLYTKRKPAWDAVDAAVPHFEEMPPPAPPKPKSQSSE